MAKQGASSSVHARDLVCANDVSISGHVIEDISIHCFLFICRYPTGHQSEQYLEQTRPCMSSRQPLPQYFSIACVSSRRVHVAAYLVSLEMLYQAKSSQFRALHPRSHSSNFNHHSLTSLTLDFSHQISITIASPVTFVSSQIKL